MKKLLVLTGLLTSLLAAAQTPPGYTKISSRYDWIATKADSGLHLPGYSTIPNRRSGVWVGAGNIGLDSVLNRIYFYSSSGWHRVMNISDTTAMLANYVPNTRTVTINGVTFDLSVNRTWNVGTLVAADTTNKYVTHVYRKTASDSVFYVKGGNHTFAFRDSLGAAGGGITSINSQTGVSQTISQGVGVLVNSAANDHNVKADTLTLSTRLWRQKGIDSVAALVALKVNISDTAAMLLNYRHWLEGYLKAADIAGKLNISDTSAMLSNYINNVGYGLARTGQVARADSATLSAYYLRRKDSLTSTNLLGYVTRTVLADTAAAIRASGGGGGEVNTASNLGGGLANFDSKSGVDLRFNSFLATDFDLAANVIGIDYVNGQAASGSVKGFLTSADWTTFNNKQAAGSYITALTGDGTATGPGSVAFTLATVNSNVGTFNNVTVNGKGLVTAASNVAYLTSETDPLSLKIANNLSDGVASTMRTNLGFTTWSGNLITTANPSAIRYIRINADNTVTLRTAAEFLSDIGGGSGTVTSVSGTTNRITSTGGATPVIDISSSYVGQSSITTLGTIATGTWGATTIAIDKGGTGNTSYTNGQLLIGNTSGNTLTKATLTQGAGITITNGNGSITIASDHAVDTVYNYDDLTKYTDPADVILVTHERYGGWFKVVSTGTENGATLKVGNDARKWQRIFDSTYWRPEWYEIGGKDKDGNAYNVSTGTGIGSEAVAIKNIVLLAGKEATIAYVNNKIYEVDQMIPIKQKQKHEGGRFKRAAPVTALLSNSEAVNSTTIEMSTVTGLRGGMWFIVKATGAAGGDYGNTSVNQTGDEGHVITAISGTTVTISSSTPIRKAMSAGDTVVTVTPFFYRENGILNVSDSDSHVQFRNCEFDGNKAQARYFNDYQQPATIEVFGGYLEAYNCTFKNSPGENIYLTGGKIEDCFMFYNQGSGLHWTNNIATMDSIYLGTYIDRLVADSNCLGDAVKQGHSEAFATGSTKSNNSYWTNCRISNNGTSASRAKSVFGNYTQDDGIIHIIGGLYTNNRQLMYLSGMDSTTMKGDRIVIRDAKFKNSGAVTISGSDIRRGNGVNGVLISNNEFTNTRVWLDNVANVRVTNNDFLTDSSNYVRWDDSRADGTSTTSWWGGNGQQTFFMITAYSDRLTITGNKFVGFDNDSLQTGVQLQLSDSIYRKQSSLMTDYYYCQAVNFSGNYISGFRYATSFGINTFAKAAVNWSLNNNTIDLARYDRFASDYVYGLQVAPGMVANGGTVTGYHPSAYSWPVMVLGVKSTGNFAKIEGGKVMNITVKGRSNYGINVDPNNASPYNTTVMNNTLYAGTINYSANATTYLLEYSGNKVLTSATMNNYQVPIIQRVGENKTQY